MSYPLALLVVVFAVACSSKEQAPSASASGGAVGGAARPPASFALAAEPAGAKPVKELLLQVKSGDEVVAVGRVGEEVPGLAAFRLVDTSLKACTESSTPDDCKTPWDYCCTPPDVLRTVAATVELRESGAALKADVIGWNGVDHLKTVVVQGRAERDSAGNLTIAATGVFVRK